MAINILVSACLLGISCRYDGISKADKEVLKLLDYEDIHLIPVCPEQLGGLPTPRVPSEIQGGNVVNKEGIDVTAQYMRGAKTTLQLAKLYKASFALLKERSPSCGHGEVYDGTFSKTLIPGDGVTVQLLHENGIRVYGESEIELLLMDLEEAWDIYPVDDEFQMIKELFDGRYDYYMDPSEDDYDPGEESLNGHKGKKAKKNGKAGKNHAWVDGQLLQTNKKYSALKNSQKEKIALWMKDEIRSFYERNGRFPYKGYNSQIVDVVYEKIEEAQIWIPYEEVAEEFNRKKHRMIKSVQVALEKEKAATDKEKDGEENEG